MAGCAALAFKWKEQLAGLANRWGGHEVDASLLCLEKNYAIGGPVLRFLAVSGC